MKKRGATGGESPLDTNSPLGSKIKQHGSLIVLNEGQILLRQGEPIPGLYLVSRGILGATSDLGDGRSRFLYPILGGMCFSPFPTGTNRADAKLQALTEAYVYLLPHEAFWSLLKADKTALRLVADLVNHTFAANTMLLAACRIPSAKDRLRAYVRAYLMFQPILGGEPFDLLDSRISQNLLAEMLGVTRPYMNQLLKAVRAEFAL